MFYNVYDFELDILQKARVRIFWRNLKLGEKIPFKNMVLAHFQLPENAEFCFLSAF